MKETLTRLYLSGQIDDAKLDQAVAWRWITSAEADDIRAQKATTV